MLALVAIAGAILEVAKLETSVNQSLFEVIFIHHHTEFDCASLYVCLCVSTCACTFDLYQVADEREELINTGRGHLAPASPPVLVDLHHLHLFTESALLL